MQLFLPPWEEGKGKGEKPEWLKKVFELLFLGRCWSRWRLCSSWCWSGILSREEAKSTATTRSLCALKCWSRSWVWGWVYWLLLFRFYLEMQPFVRAFEPVLFESACIYIFLFKLIIKVLKITIIIYISTTPWGHFFKFVTKVYLIQRWTHEIWVLKVHCDLTKHF